MSSPRVSRHDIARWIQQRTFFPDGLATRALRDEKQAQDTAVSVVLPVLHPTEIAEACARIAARLGGPDGLIDEFVVIDATPDQAAVRQAAVGARTVHVDEVLPEIASSRGWGDAIWRSQHATFGDIVVWLRVADATPEAVVRLVEPLIRHPEISFVRGFHMQEWIGDTIDVFARNAWVELFPELSGFYQPFMGSSAGRAGALSHLSIPDGSSADVAMLIDLLDLLGLEPLGQVDLGPATAEDEPAAPYFPAASVARTLLRRAGDRGRIGNVPSDAARSLLALADAQPTAALEREHLPMHIVPAYIDALRRQAEMPIRRRPIHAALLH